jgi:pimeloyl-ACP methyl ester carboxylesterase
VNYANPGGAAIELALTRLPASDPDRRIGPLLINFGGPGGAAVSSLHELGGVMFSDEMRARFDLVGFDPRGVGLSAPLDCRIDLDSYYALDLTPDTPAERAAQVEAGRQLAENCARHGGPLLQFIGTDNVVRDVERIREALGVEQISFWGPSYGASIAVQYIQEHPTRVRAFSLEDVLATDIDGGTLAKEVAVGYEQAFNAFLADCAARPDCPFFSNGDPAGAFDALMARLDGEPLIASDDPRPVTQSDILGLIDALIWRLSTWNDLAQVLAAAQAGDATLLRSVIDQGRGRRPDGTYEPPNGLYVFIAVHCVDNSFPRDLPTLERMVAEVMTLAPRTGAVYINVGYACVSWPVPHRPTPASPTGRGAPPLLVVGATLDMQTPYIWSQRLAGQLQQSVLLTRQGSGHTSYFLSRCVVEAVDAYLLDLRLPAPGSVCSSTGGLFSGP